MPTTGMEEFQVSSFRFQVQHLKPPGAPDSEYDTTGRVFNLELET